MREYTPHKDGRPRFFGTETVTVIVDDAGCHEYCKHCRRLLFEYLNDRNGCATYTCGCPAITIDDLLTQLLLTMDQCQDIESAKRMLLMFKAQRDMTNVR